MFLLPVTSQKLINVTKTDMMFIYVADVFCYVLIIFLAFSLLWEYVGRSCGSVCSINLVSAAVRAGWPNDLGGSWGGAQPEQKK